MWMCAIRITARIRASDKDVTVKTRCELCRMIYIRSWSRMTSKTQQMCFLKTRVHQEESPYGCKASGIEASTQLVSTWYWPNNSEWIRRYKKLIDSRWPRQKFPPPVRLPWTYIWLITTAPCNHLFFFVSGLQKLSSLMLDLLTHDASSASGRTPIHHHHLLCAPITISSTE